MQFFIYSLIFFFVPLSVAVFIAYQVLIRLIDLNAVKDEEKNGLNISNSMLIALLVIAGAFNVYVYSAKHIGLGVSLFILTLIIAVLYAHSNRLSKIQYFLAAVSGLAAILISFRSNEFLVALNTLVSLGTLLILVLFTLLKDVQLAVFNLIFSFIYLCVRILRNIPIISRTFTNKSNNINLVKYIRTFVFSVVIVGLFGVLLSNVDPIFESVFLNLFSEELIPRIITTFVVLFVSLVILNSSFSAKVHKEVRLSFLSKHEVVVPTALLTILFGVFIFIQIKYLFSGAVYIEKYQITYSDYVRKGFFELLITIFFGGLLSYFVSLKDRFEVQNTNIFKLINTVLLIELFFILVSAYVRDKIYIDTYGLTRMRLVGYAIISILGVFIFSLLAFSNVKTFTEAKVLTLNFVFMIAVVLGLNFVNIDKYVYSYNFSHYPIWQEKYNRAYDTFIISLLSFDTVDSWDKITTYNKDKFNDFVTKKELSRLKLETYNSRVLLSEDEKNELALLKLTINTLLSKRELLIKKYDKIGWLDYNYTDFLAYKKLTSADISYLSTLLCLQKQIEYFQAYYNVDTYSEERNRLDSFEYPLVQRIKGNHPDRLHSIKNRIYKSITGSREYGIEEDKVLNSFSYPKPSTCD